jgi:ABC-type multidrug transport system ATPase subunit
MMASGLAVDRVSMERGGRPVLTDVSFALAPGSIVVVVGPNGAGKSSLLEAILGLLPVSGGRVTFDGRTLRNLRARSAVFSYMPDEAEPPSEVSVGTLLAYAERFGRPPGQLADDLAERLGVRRLAGERAGRLSRGQKRRVSLFAALCTSRPVVVLDEPLTTFDPLQLLDVLPVLRDRAAAGSALLLSAHQMTDAERLASRVLVLDGGRVVGFGTLEELQVQVGRHGASLEDVVLELLRARGRHARP